MRKELIKLLFIGFEGDRETFFQKAQKAGLIEFIGTARSFETAIQGEISQISHALKILRGFNPLEQLQVHDKNQAAPIADAVVATRASIEKLNEKKRFINAEIHRIKPFGYFSFAELEQLALGGRVSLQFFMSKKPFHDLLTEEKELVWVSGDEAYDYWFAIAKQPLDLEKAQEVFFDKSLKDLENLLLETEEEIKLREQDLRLSAQYSQFLKDVLLEKLNDAMLSAAKNATRAGLNGSLFMIEGWVPAHRLHEVEAFCHELNVLYEEIEIEAADQIPTYLENKGINRIGEDLVGIYDTPSIFDKDPSGWVFWSFVVFFAMIINDAGYGLLFLLGILYYKYKHPHLKSFGQRFVKMAIILSSACIVWGALTTSFFGVEFDINNPLRSFSIVDWLMEKKITYHMTVHDDVYQEILKEQPAASSITNAKELLNYSVVNKAGETVYPIREPIYTFTMFELALLIGVIHIGLSIIRNTRRNWAGLGWLLFMVGGYLYFPVFLKATSMVNTVLGISKEHASVLGLEMMGVGVSAAILLALIQRRLGGILEIMTVIQILCDVLSYLRLYALGLASLMMASTFNNMAHAAGPIFGILILLVGHTVNMTMGIMGGVIHGLRLNFLEWYHYSFEGGGKPFEPLTIYRR